MVRGNVALALALCVAVLVLPGCVTGIPREALQLTPDTLERRQLQTRVFETADEAELLAASAGLLQDLGFALDESETRLGVLVASKQRDATEVGQVVGAVLIAVVFWTVTPVDDVQKIRAALITRDLGPERRGIAVRLTLQRTVWDTDGNISRIEPLDDPEIYQEFFARLSKAVFLDAMEL
jgi:hypothetical protein